jgi:hypothetical protein
VLQAQQHGIELSLIDEEAVITDLLYAPRNAMAVQWSQDIESPEDHESECPLPNVLPLFHPNCAASQSHLVTNRRIPQLHWESNR